ncbi:MAG: LON peptidase substrate-binding domain-containing protein [Nitrospiraceae bacterium]
MQIDRERDHGNDAGDKPTTFHIPERIPLFPLPNVVLFPKTYLPLHVFESRYRQMVTDMAADGRCVGMALLKEGWESDYYGNPPIYDMGCVGRLVSVQALPDGRSNILLQGLERYRIRQEFYDKSYREANVVLKPRGLESTLDTTLREDLIGILEQYLLTRGDSSSCQGFFGQNVSDDILVHTLSTSLECTPLEKQFLLEAESLEQQAKRLRDLIQFKIHERPGAKGWD